MANNLRIIYDNRADAATITTSSTAGSLVASNMQNNRKAKVWRSTTKSSTITMQWPTAEIVSGVALPFCNLTSTSTLRVRGYLGATQVFDTGVTSPAAPSSLGNWDFGALPLGVNSYSYGGGTYGVSWFSNYFSIDKMVLDILDNNNPSGYLECSRIVTGSAWSPVYNVPFGIPVTYADTSTHDRSESGDLVTTRGVRYKQISFDLSWLNSSDRGRFSSIMKGNGLSKPVFISLFPGSSDTEKEQTYQIYGKMSQISALNHTMHTMYSGHIDIEEI